MGVIFPASRPFENFGGKLGDPVYCLRTLGFGSCMSCVEGFDPELHCSLSEELCYFSLSVSQMLLPPNVGSVV